MSDNLVGRYLGELNENGHRHGKGKLTLYNGDIFEGIWKDDSIEQGSYTSLTGNIYSGSFNHNGEKHGQGNYFNKVTGDRYEGTFENDMKSGTGKMFRSNGDVILGKYVHGIELKSQVMIKYKSGDTYTGAVNEIYQKSGYGKLVCYVGDYVNVEGEFFEDEMHGRCKINYRSGKKLDAHFVHGILNGQAHIVYENGDVLDCEFVDGKKNGYGSLNRNKGERFDGYFVEDKRSGSGTSWGEDGSSYDGEWLNGKMHGKGKYTYADGGICHTTWKNGKKEGDAEVILPNGSIVKGKYFSDELREGTITYSNGDIYQGPLKKLRSETNSLKGEKGSLTGKNYFYRGEFKNGKRSGFGRIDYADGAYYEGFYLDDLKHGQGTFEMKGAKYVGDFFKGKKHGHGKIEYEEENSTYEGGWHMDSKHGKGKSCINGTIYEGEYKHGKRDGKGKLQAISGNVYEGEFKNDRKDGKGKLIYPPLSPLDMPRILEGNWEKDKFVSERPLTSVSVNVITQTLNLE